MEVFLDTNIFLAYATDFERSHQKAVIIFHGPHTRHTAIRVQAELSKIRKRRTKLYEDLDNFLGGQYALQQFKPKVEINSNDERHLAQLLGELSKTDRNKVLRLFRSIRRIIDEQIRISFSLVARPLVPISGDLACEAIIERLVTNQSDAEILVDALCWAENNHKSAIVFCTVDWTDVLSKRTDIYASICNIRLYSRSEIPIEIRSLDELVS